MAGRGLGGKRGSGTALIPSDVWVAVEPTGKMCQWKGENKFRVICCKEAFSTNSSCKFAFCPYCAIAVREELHHKLLGHTKRETASSRANKRTKAVVGVVGSDCPTGNNHQKGGGGVCGKHTLKDLLTINYEESSNSYLKCKREQEPRAENIALHCVKCGIKF